MTMQQLFEAAAISRQAFHQWMRPSDRQIQATPDYMVLELARKIRQNFLPGSSARELYYFIRKHQEYNQLLNGWGKHSFENLCLYNGFRIFSAPFKPKTTIRGVFVFPNLIQGMIIREVNKIWVSDISYIFSSKGQLIGYATSLIDLYSRLLLGLQFSQNMTAQQTAVAVIKQAFSLRKKTRFPNTIFHSDGGKQYIAKVFLEKISQAQMLSSMADNCYENPHAESFNDTLKNHILPHFQFNSFDQLKKKQKFIKKCYNQYKVHSGINRFTPMEFEEHIKNLEPCQRASLKIKEIS